jgi:hypothetical protein
MSCNETLSFANASIGRCHRPLGHRGVHKIRLLGTNIIMKIANRR